MKVDRAIQNKMLRITALILQLSENVNKYNVHAIKKLIQTELNILDYS